MVVAHAVKVTFISSDELREMRAVPKLCECMAWAQTCFAGLKFLYSMLPIPAIVGRGRWISAFEASLAYRARGA